MDEQPRCRPHIPVSVLLGADCRWGLAHVGVLRALIAGGFRVTELVGTSAGAIVTAFYGAVGLDLSSARCRRASRSRSQHLLSSGDPQPGSPRVRDRYIHLAGDILVHLGRLDDLVGTPACTMVSRVLATVSRRLVVEGPGRPGTTSGRSCRSHDAVRRRRNARIVPPLRCFG